MNQGKVTAFHRRYREQRSRGLGKIMSLEIAKRDHWDDYKLYVEGQNRGEKMEALDMSDEKKSRNMSIIMNGGKLP